MGCKTLDFTQWRIVIPESQELYDCSILLSGESYQIEAQEKEPAVSWSLGDRTGSPEKPMQIEFSGKSIEMLFERKNTGESCWEGERERESESTYFTDMQMIPLNHQMENDSCIHVKKISEERATRGLQGTIAGTLLGLGIVPVLKSITYGALGRIFRRVLSQ